MPDNFALHQGNGRDGQGTTVQTELPLGSRLSRQQLEAYLWSAADILRGSIDSSDYKNYIFGLLFLKRLSDVFEEEAEKLIAEGLPAEVAWTDPDEHQFFIPDRARWRQIQRAATNLGEVLNTAVQHMVATLNLHGQLGVVMPHGILFRGASEGQIRRRFLQEDLFEAVIGLPPNLFYGTGIPAAILVMSRAKPTEHKDKVLFIDASREYEEGSNQNTLRVQDVQKIAATFHAYQDVERYARVVSLEDIARNDGNLNISRYVDTAEEEERIDVAAAVARLRELEHERAVAEERMHRFLAELGYDTGSGYG